MPQELEVATADQGSPSFNQRDGRVAQCRCLPRVGRDALASVKGNRDVAIAGTIHAPVGGPHHQAQTPSLLRCHACVWRDPSALQGAPKAAQRFKSAKNVGIQRYQCG